MRPRLIICVVGPWLRKEKNGTALCRIGKTLKSDDGAKFDLRNLYSCIRHRTHRWGTSPQDVVPTAGRVPDPNTITDPVQRASAERALGYMGLNCHGGKYLSTKSSLGHYTNSRIEDLRPAVKVILAAGPDSKVAPNGRARFWYHQTTR